jgi:hypothetical protein
MIKGRRGGAIGSEEAPEGSLVQLVQPTPR